MNDYVLFELDCFEPNMDYPGNDIIEKRKNSVTDCLIYCRGNPGCEVFAWNKTLKHCYLKTRRGTGKYDTNFILGPLCGKRVS